MLNAKADQGSDCLFASFYDRIFDIFIQSAVLLLLGRGGYLFRC